MRYYGFANFMLSSIQQGVQNFHVIAEMFTKYDLPTTPEGCQARLSLHNWATYHKTAIFLNGGNADGVRTTYDQIATLGTALSLPFGRFYEDKESLDNTMTACGIIVPSRIVDMLPIVRSTPCDWTEFDTVYNESPTFDEVELAMFLNEFQLAR